MDIGLTLDIRHVDGKATEGTGGTPDPDSSGVPEWDIETGARTWDVESGTWITAQ